MTYFLFAWAMTSSILLFWLTVYHCQFVRSIRKHLRGPHLARFREDV